MEVGKHPVMLSGWFIQGAVIAREQTLAVADQDSEKLLILKGFG